MSWISVPLPLFLETWCFTNYSVHFLESFGASVMYCSDMLTIWTVLLMFMYYLSIGILRSSLIICYHLLLFVSIISDVLKLVFVFVEIVVVYCMIYCCYCCCSWFLLFLDACHPVCAKICRWDWSKLQHVICNRIQSLPIPRVMSTIVFITKCYFCPLRCDCSKLYYTTHIIFEATL